MLTFPSASCPLYSVRRARERALEEERARVARDAQQMESELQEEWSKLAEESQSQRQKLQDDLAASRCAGRRASLFFGGG